MVGRLAALEPLARRRTEPQRVEFRLRVEELAGRGSSRAGPVERVGAQADAHPALAALVGHPAPDAPPGLAEDRRFGRIGRPARRVLVGVVDLHAADALLVQLLELPDQPVHVERVAGPPPERHLAVAGRRVLETGQRVEVRFAAGIAGGVRRQCDRLDWIATQHRIEPAPWKSDCLPGTGSAARTAVSGTRARVARSFRFRLMPNQTFQHAARDRVQIAWINERFTPRTGPSRPSTQPLRSHSALP